MKRFRSKYRKAKQLPLSTREDSLDIPLKNCSNSLKHVIGSLDAGATPAASTKKTFRKCIGCGKDFVLVLDLPQVTHCSYKCLVDGGVLDSTDN